MLSIRTFPHGHRDLALCGSDKPRTDPWPWGATLRDLPTKKPPDVILRHTAYSVNSTSIIITHSALDNRQMGVTMRALLIIAGLFVFSVTGTLLALWLGAYQATAGLIMLGFMSIVSPIRKTLVSYLRKSFQGEDVP
jgi:hypothetical protein